MQSPTRGSSGSDMNIASVSNVPIYVAGIALAVLLFVTLIVLPRNMALTQTTHRKRHVAFLIGSSILMSFFLVIIMIDIAAFI